MIDKINDYIRNNGQYITSYYMNSDMYYHPKISNIISDEIFIDVEDSIECLKDTVFTRYEEIQVEAGFFDNSYNKTFNREYFYISLCFRHLSTGKILWVNLKGTCSDLKIYKILNMSSIDKSLNYLTIDSNLKKLLDSTYYNINILLNSSKKSPITNWIEYINSENNLKIHNYTLEEYAYLLNSNLPYMRFKNNTALDVDGDVYLDIVFKKNNERLIMSLLWSGNSKEIIYNCEDTKYLNIDNDKQPIIGDVDDCRFNVFTGSNDVDDYSENIEEMFSWTYHLYDVSSPQLRKIERLFNELGLKYKDG